MSWLADVWFVRNLILPFIDIAILSFLIYRSYQILVQTRAIQLVKGGLFMVFLYLAAYILQLQTLLWILNMIAPGLVISVAIIFQPELRKIFTRIGQGDWFRFSQTTRSLELDSVMNAISVLSDTHRGAIIVLGRSVGLKNYVDTGTRIDSELSSSLLLTIFGHDTPLHDGAVIIEGTRLVAAGCFLPLSEQPDIRRSFGTRHRAALGLAEETDAIILVVSEETGAKSMACDSKLFYDLSENEILLRLQEIFAIRENSQVQEPISEAPIEE